MVLKQAKEGETRYRDNNICFLKHKSYLSSKSTSSVRNSRRHYSKSSLKTFFFQFAVRRIPILKMVVIVACGDKRVCVSTTSLLLPPRNAYFMLVEAFRYLADASWSCSCCGILRCPLVVALLQMELRSHWLGLSDCWLHLQIAW